MANEQETIDTAAESTRKPKGFGTWPLNGAYQPTDGSGGDPDYATRRSNKTGKHNGVDISSPIGTAVGSYADGVVVRIGSDNKAGNWALIEHADVDGKKVFTMYQHLRDFTMADGRTLAPKMEVKEGEQIGHSGESGNAAKIRGGSGPQLHFEVRSSDAFGTSINPSEVGFMHLGAFGPKVKELKEQLASQGYDVGPTTSDQYDRKMEAAVKKWQTDHGYPATGVVDGNLREAMLHPDRYVSNDRSANSLAASDNPGNEYFSKVVAAIDKYVSEGTLKLPAGVTTQDIAAQMMGDAVRQKLGAPDFLNADAVSVKPSQDRSTAMLMQGQMPVAITKLSDVVPGKTPDNVQTIDSHISNQRETRVDPTLANAPSMLKVA